MTDRNDKTETVIGKPDDQRDETLEDTIVVPEGDEMVGRMLDDRFLIEKDLTEGGADKGGMGLVYLAQDMKLMGKKTVVKILRKESLEHEDILNKFLHEKEALIRLDHPNIVRILDSGELANGNPFMVMEYIPGYSLRKVLREQLRLPFDFCAHIIRQVTDALSAAHAEKILHRDIKPENIMLTPQEGGFDRTRLIDFGIAKVHGSKLAPETQTPRGIGTVLYMAPEQLYGTLDATPAQDVYSVAIVIYEMLTGEKPFQPASFVEMFELQKEGVKTLPSELRTGISPKAEEQLLRALAFKAENRPQNAREFGIELANAIEFGEQAASLGQTEIADPALAETEAFIPADTGDQPDEPVTEQQELGLSTAEPAANNATGDNVDAATESKLPPAETIEPNETAETEEQGSSEPSERSENRAYLFTLAGFAVAVTAILSVVGGTAYWYSTQESTKSAQTAAPLGTSRQNVTKTNDLPAKPQDSSGAENETASRRFSFHLMVQKMRDGKPFEQPFRSTGQEIFETGYKFRMVFEEIPAGYFYLFNEGRDAEGINGYNILFPTPVRNDGSAQINENQKVETGNNTFAETRGTEYVWVIWSLEEVVELESIREFAFQNAGKVADTAKSGQLRAVIEKYHESTIDVKKDSAAQSSFFNGKGNLVAYKIELEHR